MKTAAQCDGENTKVQMRHHITKQHNIAQTGVFLFRFYQSLNNQVVDGTGIGYLKQSSKVDYDTIYIYI